MTAAAIILGSIIILFGLRQVADRLGDLTEAVNGLIEGDYSEYLGDTDNPIHRMAHTLHMIRSVIAPTHGEVEERGYDAMADVSSMHDEPVPLLERISNSLEQIQMSLRQIRKPSEGDGSDGGLE